MAKQPTRPGSTSSSRQPRGAARCGGLHAVRHLRCDECLRADGPVTGRCGAVSRRDRRRSGRAPWPGERRADQRAAGDRHHRDERHRDRAVRGAGIGGLDEGPLSASGRLAPAGCTNAAPCCARPARGSFCWPRPGCSTAGTPRCISATPGRSRPPIQPFRFIPERVLMISGVREELVSSGASSSLARHGAAPDRPLCRFHGGAGSRAHVRAAMASRRTHAVHRVRRQDAITETRRSRARSSGWASTSRSPIRWRK